MARRPVQSPARPQYRHDHEAGGVSAEWSPPASAPTSAGGSPPGPGSAASSVTASPAGSPAAPAGGYPSLSASAADCAAAMLRETAPSLAGSPLPMTCTFPNTAPTRIEPEH